MSSPVRRVLWLVLVLAAAVALATVAIPTLYVQPFKPQQAEMLARAYALRRAAPVVTAICLPIVLLSALALTMTSVTPGSVAFKRQRGLTPRDLRGLLPPALRALTVVLLVGVTSLVTWFSRQNHFEWMFAPPAEVKYVPAADASRFLTGDEMVMGIEVNGLALAYPIRQMAYHHVVNDMFGTTPVVVTY
jgi:hypothetical protein